MDEAYPKAYSNMDPETPQMPISTEGVMRLPGSRSSMDHSFWGYTRQVWGLAWKTSGGDVRGIVFGGVIFVFAGLGVWATRHKFDAATFAWTIGVSTGVIALILVWFLWRSAHQTHMLQRAEIADLRATLPQLADLQADLEIVELLRPRVHGMVCELKTIWLEGNLANPINEYIAKLPMEQWRPDLIQIRLFQRRYELLLDFLGATGKLSIAHPSGVFESCRMFPYPSDVSSKPLVEMMEKYVRFADAQAAKLREDIVKLTIS